MMVETMVDFDPPSPPPTPVSIAEIESRIDAVRAELRRDGLAALVVASPESIFHLTGLDHLGYFAVTLLVIPRAGTPRLVARRMERHTLAAQVPRCRHVPYADGEDAAEVTARVLTAVAAPDGVIGVEAGSMFLPPVTLDRMRAAAPGLGWTDRSALPPALRRVKSAVEIERVRRAAVVSGITMRTALSVAAAGVSERAVAAWAQLAMIGAGGDPPGFVPLIRSTARIAHEHVTYSDHVLTHGEGLFVELSGCVQRYHAPMSRVVYCGEAPPGAELAATAAAAGQDAARERLVPGTRTRDVYGAWEDAVAAATGVRQRRHHCGYLTGIGFAPSWVGGGEVLGIHADGETVVEPGMVFHLMSWVSEPVAHVVSDTVLVTDDGTELLTEAPRGLLVTSAPARFPTDRRPLAA